MAQTTQMNRSFLRRIGRMDRDSTDSGALSPLSSERGVRWHNGALLGSITSGVLAALLPASQRS